MFIQERTLHPYRAHVGRFVVDIGNGTQKGKHDYCAIIQGTGEIVVLVKNGNRVAAFDGRSFLNDDFSRVLNYKQFKTEKEAYDKLMRWIGKMVKKDERARYYTNTRYKDYEVPDDAFDLRELREIRDVIRQEI